MKATTFGTLEKVNVEFSNENACCVIMASSGYPEKYKKGFEISIDEEVEDSVYVAGATIVDGTLKTSGGRVLGVTAVDETLKKAIEKAYKKVEKVRFDNSYFRTDIGAKALEKSEN